MRRATTHRYRSISIPPAVVATSRASLGGTTPRTRGVVLDETVVDETETVDETAASDSRRRAATSRRARRRGRRRDRVPLRRHLEGFHRRDLARVVRVHRRGVAQRPPRDALLLVVLPRPARASARGRARRPLRRVLARDDRLHRVRVQARAGAVLSAEPRGHRVRVRAHRRRRDARRVESAVIRLRGAAVRRLRGHVWRRRGGGLRPLRANLRRGERRAVSARRGADDRGWSPPRARAARSCSRR